MRKLLLVCALIAGVTVSAQGQRKGNHGNKGDRGHQMERPDFTPEQIATIKVKELTLMLDLNESQQTAVQKLELAAATDRKAKMETRKASKEELTDDERYALINERLDKRIEFKNSMRSILNDEQFEKWEKAAARRGKHAKQRNQNGPRHGKR